MFNHFVYWISRHQHVLVPALVGTSPKLPYLRHFEFLLSFWCFLRSSTRFFPAVLSLTMDLFHNTRYILSASLNPDLVPGVKNMKYSGIAKMEQRIYNFPPIMYLLNFLCVSCHIFMYTVLSMCTLQLFFVHWKDNTVRCKLCKYLCFRYLCLRKIRIIKVIVLLQWIG